jgi:hypothetical protein
MSLLPLSGMYSEGNIDIIDGPLNPNLEEGDDISLGEEVQLPKIKPSPFRKNLPNYGTKVYKEATDIMGRRYCTNDGWRVPCPAKGEQPQNLPTERKPAPAGQRQTRDYVRETTPKKALEGVCYLRKTKNAGRAEISRAAQECMNLRAADMEQVRNRWIKMFAVGAAVGAGITVAILYRKQVGNILTKAVKGAAKAVDAAEKVTAAAEKVAKASAAVTATAAVASANMGAPKDIPR